MGVDEHVRDLFEQVTPHPDRAIDVEQVMRGGRRRTTRRTALVTGAAALLVAGTVGAVQLAGGDHPSTHPKEPLDPAPTMAWRAGPAMPLSPRWEPFAIWTGHEALVFGGLSRTFEGGPAPFPDLTDGAAFDPETSTWRPLADSPRALGSMSYGTSLVVGDTVVVVQGGSWLAYDISDDRWRTLPAPQGDSPQPTLAADPAAGLVYSVDRYVEEIGGKEPVQVLDLGTDTWSPLPASPHTPQLDDRTLVLTPQGLVMMGDDLYPRQAGDGRETSRAELWDGESWSRFSDSDLYGGGWAWTGERIIATILRTRRDHGSGGALDPASGQWSTLPVIPNGSADLVDGGWPTTDGARVLFGGYLYDDTDGSLTPIPSPDQTLSRYGAVLGYGRLMLFGGHHVDPKGQQGRITDVEPTAETWVMSVQRDG